MAKSLITAFMSKAEQMFGLAGPVPPAGPKHKRTPKDVTDGPEPTGPADKEYFMAFLFPGLKLQPGDLDFSNEWDLTPQRKLNASANFAFLVNLIPRISKSWSSDGRMLWDVYERVLRESVLAASPLSEKERQNLKKQRKVLYQVKKGPGGERIRVDSPILAAYRRYQEAYLQIERRYNHAKLTAENSSNPEKKQKWLLREPRLKAKLRLAEHDWSFKGYRKKVERAFAVIDQLTGRSPMTIWAEWKDEFQQSKLKDLRNSDFYQTTFYPPDFFNVESKGQWTEFTLDADEIESYGSLAERFPGEFPGLFKLLTTSMGNLPVSRFTMDLTRISIIRPWMNSGIFKSRFWKWPDAREPLSDGCVLPRGSLVAYITDALLARDIEIEFERPPLSGETKELDTLKDSLLLNQTTRTPGSSSIKSEGMQIIAFICQKLPRSPNPDPALPFSR